MRLLLQHISLCFSLSFLTAARAYSPRPYQSLAGLSNDEIELFIRESGSLAGAHPAPGPLKDDSAKLVNDAAHPFKAPGPNDIRGPCPGLNTLASHGYLDRSGIVTPQDIVNAVQEGFNMGNTLAVFVTWGAFLVDGNHLTNLMSIGQKSAGTGRDPPAPAIVGGLNTHGVFEGDASTTRGDFFFGDNFHFNETLFDQLVETSNRLGGGKYNQTVAGEVRWNRIQDSMARNPTYNFLTPRYFTAYAESVFPYLFFVDGRSKDAQAQLDLTVARGFFQNSTFPADFWRRNGSISDISTEVAAVSGAHFILPGQNEGAGNYVVDPNDAGFAGGTCAIYTKHVNVTLRSLYPNPTGSLQKALRENIATFYNATADSNCTQLFPYGQ